MKRKTTPLDQGVLRNIYNYFIGPLLCYKPDNITLKDWMADLFHLDYRTIETYTARRDFELPGLLYVAPHVKIQGLGYRTIKTKDQVYVRHDVRDSFYDVEFFGGVGESNQCFQLSQSQWNSIGAFLEPTEGGLSRKKRLREERKLLKTNRRK